MTADEIQSLAALHVKSLPDSLVSVMGGGYARSFYRYVSRSSREIVLMEKDDRGTVVAACVASLDPSTLNRRLLFATPLLAYALPKAPRILRMLLSGSEGSLDAIPELILIYTSEEARGRGVGANLVSRLERELSGRGVSRYQVKTIADQANRALEFYSRIGFQPLRVITEGGRRFQVFTKPVGR